MYIGSSITGITYATRCRPSTWTRTLSSPWDRPPQTVYLLPHWASYIHALQQVTGLPRSRYVPYYSKDHMLAMIFYEHRVLTNGPL